MLLKNPENLDNDRDERSETGRRVVVKYSSGNSVLPEGRSETVLGAGGKANGSVFPGIVAHASRANRNSRSPANGRDSPPTPIETAIVVRRTDFNRRAGRRNNKLKLLKRQAFGYQP